ncbi:MAG: 2-oxoglutarate oxidoreductase [Prevotellaceae bacterium]|nr:2-oxoglutarate oxidoreductase [Prevotellaceae bacterium]
MTVEEIIKPENLTYKKSPLLTDAPMHYCPGCSHGTVHKILAEVLEDLNAQENSIGITPVGCSVLLYNYIDIDWIEAAHGRAPAVATAAKRLYPNKHIFAYQGDGDLAAIGTGEIIHTCNRGDNVTIIFINNGIYGMTGGQMAPTTLLGMPTATTPYGRDPKLNGYPFKVSEIMAQLPGTGYVTRQAVHTPGAVRQARKALKKAFEKAYAGKGTSFIEIVATCSSGWKLSPVDSNKWMTENMFPFYPLGDLKDVE